jgi:hypothetical protein
MRNHWKVFTLCAAVLVLFLTVPVQAQVTATPIVAVPIPPQQVPPDLQHSNLVITSPSVLRCGTQTVTFTVNETNAGSSAGIHHNDLLYDYGSGSQVWPICRVQRPSFPALSSRTWSFSCTFWNGPCDCLPTNYTATFITMIDSLNAIAESNENNNRSNRVSIPATCP